MHLLQDDPPRMEPLEVDNGQEEVNNSKGDDEGGKQPPQLGQQVIGFVLLGKGANVFAEQQMSLCHF